MAASAAPPAASPAASVSALMKTAPVLGKVVSCSQREVPGEQLVMLRDSDTCGEATHTGIS